MLKHYLACLCKGSSIYSWKIKQIPSRDAPITKLASETYAYFVFDTNTTSEETPSVLDARNLSPVTYLGGEIYSMDDVRKMVKKEHVKIHISSLPGTPITKISKTKQVIHTKGNSWIPFYEEDILITIE